jgi:hypothetical protein
MLVFQIHFCYDKKQGEGVFWNEGNEENEKNEGNEKKYTNGTNGTNTTNAKQHTHIRVK